MSPTSAPAAADVKYQNICDEVGASGSSQEHAVNAPEQPNVAAVSISSSTPSKSRALDTFPAKSVVPEIVPCLEYSERSFMSAPLSVSMFQKRMRSVVGAGTSLHQNLVLNAVRGGILVVRAIMEGDATCPKDILRVGAMLPLVLDPGAHLRGVLGEREPELKVDVDFSFLLRCDEVDVLCKRRVCVQLVSDRRAHLREGGVCGEFQKEANTAFHFRKTSVTLP